MMSQRAVIAEHMWAEYITLDQHYQSQDASKTHQGLWDLMLQSLKDDDSVKVTEDNPIESFMTIKAMAEYCIKKNWLVATETGSDDPLTDLVLSIATEFENASQLFSNDEG